MGLSLSNTGNAMYVQILCLNSLAAALGKVCTVFNNSKAVICLSNQIRSVMWAMCSSVLGVEG
jgi:hypothetical protein